MKVITFREDGEKVRLCDLEPGTLFEHNSCIALKSEYQTNRGLIEAAIVDSGEQFWGGAKTVQEQRELLVQPFVLTEDEDTPTIDAVEVVRCNWIPVSERLPEEGGYVLAIVSGRVGNICLVRAVELAEFSMDEGWILEIWPDWENPTVSHWMPLPEPPEEEHHEA